MSPTGALAVERYPVSMTGVHGAGKKTLAAGLRAHYGWHDVPTSIFALGRMLDVEGLWACRDNALEQNRLVREAPRPAVTSRFGLLDVAIYACVMVEFGRIASEDVAPILGALEEDLTRPETARPFALIAMVCDAEILQERLLDRDRSKKRTAARGLRKLEKMNVFMSSIFERGDYPHPLIATVVEGFRTAGRLTLLDTSRRDAEETRRSAVRFLVAVGIPRTRG